MLTTAGRIWVDQHNSGKAAERADMPRLTMESIDSITNYHAPTPEAIELHGRTRSAMATALERLNEALPDTRELSLVNTKIEEAMFWANAAIARNHDQLPPIAEQCRRLDAERSGGDLLRMDVVHDRQGIDEAIYVNGWRVQQGDGPYPCDIEEHSGSRPMIFFHHSIEDAPEQWPQRLSEFGGEFGADIAHLNLAEIPIYAGIPDAGAPKTYEQAKTMLGTFARLRRWLPAEDTDNGLEIRSSDTKECWVIAFNETDEDGGSIDEQWGSWTEPDIEVAFYPTLQAAYDALEAADRT